ncbi:transposase [Paraglaciecola sp. 2405UD69-4]|uniref:transposase n=1 Tax=Paraglaciecola sp. 2405UD69-4 TaxID=3391836 RepID=UPI0039C9A82D
MSGFSLHAGVFAYSDQPDKLERLCCYIARPVVSEKRLSLTTTGNVRYELKTPYTDGTPVTTQPTSSFRRLILSVSWPL